MCVLCVCVVWDLCVLSHPAVAVAAIYGPPPSDTTILFSHGLYATRESSPVEIDNDMGIEDAAKPLDPLRDRNSCLLENQ